MDRVLYTAMNGALASERAQQLHANNLANARTTGFVADFAQARSVQAFGDGQPSRVFALTETPGPDLAPGTLMRTDRPLDVAVTEGGFLTVADATGQEAYTRAGHLVVDALGVLRTGEGREVLGEGGTPISLPPYERISIGADGTVSIQPLGEAPGVVAAVERIKLVKPAGEAVEKGGDGLIRRRDGAVEPASIDVQLRAGMLEDSNVNAVSEMVSVLDMARRFEMQLKLMKTAQEMDESATTLVRIS